jgi:hypothetical protein
MAGTTSYAPTFQDYLKYWNSGDQSSFSESGATDQKPQLSEEAFNALGDDDKWSALGDVQSRETSGRNMIALAPDDPRAKALIDQTGMEAGRGIAIVHGNQSDVHFGDSKFWNDPSKVIDLGGGNYAFAPNNMTPYAQAQGHDLTLAGKIIIGLTTAAVGGEAFGAFGDAGSTAGIASTDAAESGGTLALNAAGTGTTPYVGSAAATGGAAGGAGLSGEPPPPTDGGAPVSNGSTPIPGDGPAPVTNGSTPIPGSGGGGGVIDGVRSGFNSIANYYNSLTPAARLVLGTALSQGTGAILRGISQREALQQQKDLTNQQREDIRRRGQVQAFGDGAFKPNGIVDSRRNGGG